MDHYTRTQHSESKATLRSTKYKISAKVSHPASEVQAQPLAQNLHNQNSRLPKIRGSFNHFINPAGLRAFSLSSFRVEKQYIKHLHSCRNGTTAAAQADSTMKNHISAVSLMLFFVFSVMAQGAETDSPVWKTVPPIKAVKSETSPAAMKEHIAELEKSCRATISRSSKRGRSW